jgi:hypothetical protein
VLSNNTGDGLVQPSAIDRIVVEHGLHGRVTTLGRKPRTGVIDKDRAHVQRRG